MPGQALTRLMGERGLLKELSVRPTSAIKGQLLPEVHTNLSALDIKGAFAACQDAEPGAPALRYRKGLFYGSLQNPVSTRYL